VAEPNLFSLLPIIVTLVVALTSRNVLVGLFTGVVVGVAMVAETTMLAFVPTLVRDHIVPEVADTYNASVLVLLAFIGGFVRLIEFSGGGRAFAALATRWVSSRLRASLGAWLAGIMIFFSDLGTPLIVGPVFRPLTDRLRVSRQKLAFILDSTSSPVAILIPFIGWGVFIMSVIADAFSASGITTGEWEAFVSAIPYQLYAWLAIAMVPVLALLNLDYGPMAGVERTMANTPIAADERERASTAGPILVWLPLCVLGLTLFATLAAKGFPFERVAGADFRAALSAAYLLAAVTLVVLMVRARVCSVVESFKPYIDGMSGMMTIGATLVLAWTLGTLGEALGTGAYAAELAQEGIPGSALPAATFALAAIISFATGSSWGTIVIVMPLAVPAAVSTEALMPVVIGSVPSGGLFGDHCSPVSETTILSSTGAGTTPLEHFRTQLPYALTNGAIALAGYLLAGLAGLPWIAVAAVAVQGVALGLMATFRAGRAPFRAVRRE
jgi:Na+/H+ antiporter NhaC